MATIIFSPPIIKIILSLAMVITAIGVTVWLIRDDIEKLKKMREQAERAEKIWGRAGKEKGAENVGHGGNWPTVTKGKIDDGQVSDLFPEPPFQPRTYPIQKNKNRKPKKDNPKKDNHNRHKGGGAK